jgi:DNA-binding transcriptional ArsR family regulator
MINVERALDALGDPTRRLVLKRLRRGGRSVQDIADGMEVSRPAVSQHLQILRTAGLVVVRTAGTRHLYAVDPRAIEAVRGWFHEFWDDALAAFKQAAEREAAKQDRDKEKEKKR